jgi:TRAP-type mannitol/chloroaromatic compound transport system permease small subunit
VLVVQFSWEYAMSGLERETSFPAAGILYPVYPLFFLIPIAFAMIIVENVFVLIRNILIKEPTLVMNIEDNGPEELL